MVRQDQEGEIRRFGNPVDQEKEYSESKKEKGNDTNNKNKKQKNESSLFFIR